MKALAKYVNNNRQL